MKRRAFLGTSLAAAVAAGFSGEGLGQAAETQAREYYVIRRYALQSGPQTSLTEKFLSEAFIPALARRGMGPVGAFQLSIGPETPVYYVLIPGKDVAKLTRLDLDLAHDDEFMKAAEPFWAAPATAPAFKRAETSLFAAFEGWPRLTLPPASAGKGKRVFQLRTYESPSNKAHVDKVKMFHSGEFDVFARASFHMVFFGDMLVGTRMPCLTYMLSATNTAELDAAWAKFGSDPEWKKLTADPRFNYEEIVSNITNLILNPLSASQI